MRPADARVLDVGLGGQHAGSSSTCMQAAARKSQSDDSSSDHCQHRSTPRHHQLITKETSPPYTANAVSPSQLMQSAAEN